VNLWYDVCMTPKLTHDLDDAIRQQGSPLYVVGADDKSRYVIITDEQFEKFRALFDQDRFSHSEQREVLRRNGERAGWDDPEMDAYDDYDAHHPTAS